MNCKHCNRAYNPENMSRGLCRPCYKNDEIRCLYPCEKRGRKKGTVETPEDRITEEELDRMIAERRPTMPKRGCDNHRTDYGESTRIRYIPHAVARGRGIQASVAKPRRRDY